MSDVQGVSVYTYFSEKFGYPPDDDTLKDLPVLSNCGDDCRKAIDTAAEFGKSVNMANPGKMAELLDLVNYTIEVYWHG